MTCTGEREIGINVRGIEGVFPRDCTSPMLLKTISCISIIGLFTHHEKFEKQLQIHRKKASNHILCKNTKAKSCFI